MPTYEYACPDCGYKFEQKQKFTDDPVKKCPRCEKRHVYRVVGQVAVTFKGSGWYITDSKSSGEKHTLEHKKKEPAPAADAPVSSGDKAEKTETKTESKPAPEKAAEKAKAA